MMRLTIAGLAAAMTVACVFVPTQASAQVVGRYAVEGQNPNGSRYEGVASVERTGSTYRVVWIVGSARFVGTGIGNDEAVAITYRSGNNTGIALLGREGRNYGLVWTYAGGTDLGTERWTRR